MPLNDAKSQSNDQGSVRVAASINLDRDIVNQRLIMAMHLGFGYECVDTNPTLRSMFRNSQLPGGLVSGQPINNVTLARMLRALAHALDPFDGDQSAANPSPPSGQIVQGSGRRLRLPLDE